jgi:acyl-[acyl-carrier-protein]-phospholipid O-acyltransferase/long-chain-fatty-acid--[acyl-carrier-protein] ligase
MLIAGLVVLGVVAAILAGAATEHFRLGLSYRQALLYLPLKLLYRVRDGRARLARKAQAPVIYAISHQSRLDPALMLCLLPDNTLHILDGYSARSYWLEPWREVARTIAFNASHVFVSRRLVRHLKGKGRLAVYFQDIDETDARAFRLYRAVARIARKAEASIVPVVIGGARELPFALSSPPEERRFLPKLEIRVLEPLTLAEITARSQRETSNPSFALFDRVEEARHTPQQGALKDAA